MFSTHHVPRRYSSSISYVRSNHTYDMVDEFPIGNQSLTNIINLKQLHRLFFTFSELKGLLSQQNNSVLYNRSPDSYFAVLPSCRQ